MTRCPLLDKVEALLSKLSDEGDRELVKDLVTVAENARNHVEMGQGTYQLMRAIVKVYEPEMLNLERWTK